MMDFEGLCVCSSLLETAHLNAVLEGVARQ